MIGSKWKKPWKKFPWIYERRSLPGPGSENIAFLTLALPAYTPIGAGIANRQQFMFQGPVLVVPHLIGVTDLGGNATGQFVSTPLTVVQGSTTEQIDITIPS